MTYADLGEVILLDQHYYLLGRMGHILQMCQLAAHYLWLLGRPPSNALWTGGRPP
jgi:hypothetical protein